MLERSEEDFYDIFTLQSCNSVPDSTGSVLSHSTSVPLPSTFLSREILMIPAVNLPNLCVPLVFDWIVLNIFSVKKVYSL